MWSDVNVSLQCISPLFYPSQDSQIASLESQISGLKEQVRGIFLLHFTEHLGLFQEWHLARLGIWEIKKEVKDADEMSTHYRKLFTFAM